MNEWGETVEEDPGTEAPETQEHNLGNVPATDRQRGDGQQAGHYDGGQRNTLQTVPSNIRGLYVEESSASADSPCRTLELPHIC